MRIMYKIIFCFLIYLFFVSPVFSQSWNELNTKLLEYYNKGDYKKAIEYGEKAIIKSEIEFGKKHEYYAVSLNNLALMYYSTSNFKKAELLYLEANYVIKENYGDRNPNYATSLNNLALMYCNMGAYTKAETLNLEVIKIRKEILGEKHPDYAISLNNLGLIYYNMGEYKKAEQLYLEASEIQKLIHGENHTDYATPLNNLAELYRTTGNYEKAESLFIKVIKIDKESSGERHPNYATSINNLGLLYSNMGYYIKAEPLLTEALNIRKQVLGEKHSDYASSLNNLATLYFYMGNYTKAETFFKEASKIYKIILGQKHPYYATFLNNLAGLYTETGDYLKAEQLYLESMIIRKEVLGENNSDYAQSLNNLALLFISMGNYTKAKLLLLESMKIRKEVYGETNPNYAESLNNIALLYTKMSDYSKAESSYIKSAQIYKETLGEVHPDYASVLNNLAETYWLLNDFAKAEQLYLESLKIRKEVLGNKHSNYASSLNNLALLYKYFGNFTKSESLCIEALKINKTIFGEKHPEYAVFLNNLANLYWDMGDYSKAKPFFLDANINLINQINTYFPIFSETEKEKFLKMININFEGFYSFSINYYKDIPEISSDMLNLRLSTKGVVLSSMNRIKESVSKSGDTELIALSDKLTMTKKSLYNASLLSLEEQTKRGINFTELENEANNLEKELSRKSDEYRELLEEKDITYEQIRNSLANDEAVVEFIDFRYWDKRWTDTTYYVALITRPEYKTPVLVKLCTEDELGSKLNFTLGEVIRGFDPEDEPGSISLSEKYKDIYNLIWKPLEEHLRGCNMVYISPSGGLNKISFAALSPDGDSYLMDKINIRYTGNPRDIVSEKKREGQVTINSAVLFGGAYYDTDAEILKSYQRSGEITESREVINPFAYTNEKDKLIGEDNPTVRGSVWNYLPGTLQEVKDIGGLLSEKGIATILDTGYYANEQNLKLLSGSKNAQILHISTHGFFFTDAEKDYSKTMMGITDNKQTTSIIDNPLYRSGIVLSGAGKNSEKKEMDPGNQTDNVDINNINTTEDGIITAYEISLFDLSNTELAVLSACETGLGDIKGGEGVYGLQRSFKTAGAKNVIISLWKVPDKETGELMKIFYNNWLNKNMNKRDALIEAQKEMKKKNPNPYYWAAFVMM